MIRCRLFGHKPYVENRTSAVEFTVGAILAEREKWTDELLDTLVDARPDDVVVFGGCRRWCGRCGTPLPGDTPQTGDYRPSIREHVANRQEGW